MSRIFKNMSPFKAWGYDRVDTSEESPKESPESSYLTLPKQRSNDFLHLTMFIVILLLTLGLGFFAGRYLPPLFPSDFLMAPAGNLKKTWHYNHTFSNAPTKETEEAWLSIFPRGRGFFSHPSLDVNISGIAVFHELHCLSGIRVAYYDAINQNKTFLADYSSNPDAKIDAANAHTDPHHIRHCFDYLRQALMCAADTNLEVIDWKLGGSTGWGFERKCRDYDTVVEWAEKWRRTSQVNIT